jgi:hypothetical protein
MIGPWVVSSPTGRSPGDHVCWPFRHHEDLVAGARAYLTEGLARDERVAYVSERPLDELRHDLDGVADLEGHVERGQLDVLDGLGRDPCVPAPSLRETSHLLAEVAEPVAFIEAATGRSANCPLPVLR